MAIKPKFEPRKGTGLTKAGDLYVPGDALPQPEVTEKNTDSVWALWSDLVNETDKPEPQKDFNETVPMDLESLDATVLMPLRDMPKDSDK